MAATRQRWVGRGRRTPLQELDERLRVRRECGGAGVVRTVIAFITDGGAVNS
jgi:hypothetical protein